MNGSLNNILLITALFSLFLSIFFYLKKNYQFSLFTTIILGASLRIYTALDPFIHEWDERYHALVAKNFIKHPLIPTLYDIPLLNHEYGWTSSHIWLHKQPVTLWLMSASIYLFGNTDFAIRIPSLIMSAMAILLIYDIARSLWDKKTASIAAFFFAINGLAIELSAGRVATDHVDIAFLFFTLLASYIAVRGRFSKSLTVPIGIGISVGLAVLCKWLPALIILPFYFFLIVKNQGTKKSLVSLLISFIITILVALPWQLFIHINFPEQAMMEQNHNLLHFTQVLDNQGGSWYYFINKIRINYGELIYLPLIWFIFSYSKWEHKNHWYAFIIILFIPTVFFSLAATKMQGYLMFIAPFFFLITAKFLTSTASYSFLRRINNIIILVFVLIGIRYGLERVKPFNNRTVPIWKNQIVEIQKKYQGNKLVIFNSTHPIETMYYTDFIAYSGIPSKNEIVKIQSMGYHYIILEN